MKLEQTHLEVADVASTPHYNWRQMVAAERPGTQNAAQQSRLEALGKVIENLREWTLAHRLDPLRVKECAYVGCVFTTVPTPHDQALLAAKFSLWTYNLDRQMDQLDYSALGEHASTEAQLAYLDLQLSAILRPMYEAGYLSLPQAAVIGADHYLTQPAEKFASEVHPFSPVLGQALLALYRETEQNWLLGQAPASERHNQIKGVLTRYSTELLHLIKRMRREVYDSFIFKLTKNKLLLPDMEEYIEGSKYTIAARWVAVSINGFEANPDSTWVACLTALDSCARIGRIVNDLGNYWTELVVEQKINCVSLALVQLGYEPIADYPQDSPELAQAADLVMRRVRQEVERVVEHSKSPLLETSALMYYCCKLPAFLLAMYEKGDFLIPD